MGPANWRWTPTGLFTCASAYKTMHNRGVISIHQRALWKLKVPNPHEELNLPRVVGVDPQASWWNTRTRLPGARWKRWNVAWAVGAMEGKESLDLYTGVKI